MQASFITSRIKQKFVALITLTSITLAQVAMAQFTVSHNVTEANFTPGQLITVNVIYNYGGLELSGLSGNVFVPPGWGQGTGARVWVAPAAAAPTFPALTYTVNTATYDSFLYNRIDFGFGAADFANLPTSGTMTFRLMVPAGTDVNASLPIRVRLRPAIGGVNQAFVESSANPLNVQPPPPPTFSNANPANGYLGTNPPLNQVTAGQEITFTVTITPAANTTLTLTGFDLFASLWNAGNGKWDKTTPIYTNNGVNDYIGFMESGTSVVNNQQVKTLNGQTFRWTKVATEIAGVRTFTWVVPSNFTDKNQGPKVVRASIGGIQANQGEDGFGWAVQVNPVNQPPLINSFTPTTPIASANEDDAFSFTVNASDADAPIDTLGYEWFYSIDNGATYTGVSPQPGGNVYSGTIPFDLIKHSTKTLANYKVKAVVKDYTGVTPAGSQAEQVWTITTVNDTNRAPNSPAAPVITATPSNTFKPIDLTCTVIPPSPTDPDSAGAYVEPLRYTYVWHDTTAGRADIPGAVNTTATTDVLANASLIKGHTYSCTVTVNDIPYGGTVVTADSKSATAPVSDPFTVTNATPQVVAAAPSGWTKVNSTTFSKFVLSANVAGNQNQILALKDLVTDADEIADVVLVSQISADPAHMSSWVLATNTGIVTFTPSATRDLGNGEFDVSFTFNVTDGGGAHLDGDVTVNLLIRNNQAPNQPTAAVLASNPTPAYKGAVLTVTVTPASPFDPDTVHGDPAQAYYYSWKKDGTLILKDGPVLGTTRTSAEAGITIVKGTWTCDVTAYDGIGESVVRPSGEIVVNNSKPTLTGTVTITANPTPAVHASILTAVTLAAAMYDNDPEDTPIFKYQWQKNAGGTGTFADIAGATNATLANTAREGVILFRKNDILRVNVTAYDGTVNSDTTLTSAGTTIGNTAPVAQDIPPAGIFDVADRLTADLHLTPYVTDPDVTSGVDAFTFTIAAAGNNLDGPNHGTTVLRNFGGRAGENGVQYTADWPELAQAENNTDTFDYQVSDGTASDTATVTVTVIGVNDLPVAYNAYGFTKAGEPTPETKPIIIRATDVDNNATLSFFIGNYENKTGAVPSTTGMSTLKGGNLTQIIPERGADTSIRFIYTPPGGVPAFRGVDTFYYYAKDNNDPAGESPTAKVTITIGTPQWYPYFAWPAVGDYTWYNIQITDGDTVILDTNIERFDMMPQVYILAGNDGLVCGDEVTKNYTYTYRGWNPETDQYQAIDPEQGGQIEVPFYNYADAPTNLDRTVDDGTRAGTGNVVFTFVAGNAQGYVLEVTNTATDVTQTFKNYFMPDAEGVVPLNQETVESLNFASGDYSWRVRGFNPLDTQDGMEQWTAGEEFTIAGTITPPDISTGAPTINFPTNNARLFTNTDTGKSNPIPLDWSDISGAAGYVIYLANMNGTPVQDFQFKDVGNSSNFELPPLPPGRYVFYVIAYNAANPRQYGPWSTPVYFDVVDKDEGFAPTITDAIKSVPGTNELILTWIGVAPETVNVLYFYVGASGWQEFKGLNATSPTATTVKIAVPGIIWAPNYNFVIIQGFTATKEGPSSEMFYLEK